MFVLLLARTETSAARFRLALFGGLAGLIALALPFLARNVSLLDYINYFRLASREPFSLWLFEKNIVFAAFLLMPSLWIYYLFRPRLPVCFTLFAIASLVCIGAVAVPASAVGAGPYHLLPFSPSMVWAFQVLRNAASSDLPTAPAKAAFQAGTVSLLAALLVGYSPIVLMSWEHTYDTYRNAPLLRAAVSEIRDALDNNPGLTIAVGPATGSHFALSNLEVVPVFFGNPLPIDTASWMTFQSFGVGNNMVLRILSECRVDLLLIPTGVPLTSTNLFNGTELFSREVRDQFDASYLKYRSGRVFDQWKCRKHAS
jgi:hypothetical protein